MISGIDGAAAEYVARLFNGQFEDHDDTATVGVSQSQLLRPDPERVSVLVVNLSPNTIHLGFKETVSSTRGIKLSPNGGHASFNVRDDFILPTRPIHLIADAAGSAVYYLTVRRYSSEIT